VSNQSFNIWIVKFMSIFEKCSTPVSKQSSVSRFTTDSFTEKTIKI
jgi:hypothetical protein